MQTLFSTIIKQREFYFLVAAFFITAFAFGQSGDQIYQTYCASCHGDKMQGTAAGSALIKKRWTYGGSRKAILNSIAKGIPRTTMIGWSSALSASQLAQLTNYILLAQKSPAIRKKI